MAPRRMDEADPPGHVVTRCLYGFGARKGGPPSFDVLHTLKSNIRKQEKFPPSSNCLDTNHHLDQVASHVGIRAPRDISQHL